MRDGDGDLLDNGSGPISEVSLTMDIEDIGFFFPLLQSGVRIPARVECTLDNFLHEQLGLDPEYVSERVTTIFVDGRATDRLQDTFVKNGSTIALSAAMPGVVGATLRRGSFYAAMRSGITSLDRGSLGKCINGSVSVKLFNLLLNDLGPYFLAMGIQTSLSELSEIFHRISDDALGRCAEIRIDGRSAGPESMRRVEDHVSGDEIILSVRFV